MRCTLCTEGLANEAPRFDQPDSYCLGAHSGARPCDVTGRFRALGGANASQPSRSLTDPSPA